MWSKIKNAAKTIRRGVAGAGRLGWNGVKLVTGRILRFPEWTIGRMGFRWNKKLLLDVVILSDQNGPITTSAEVVPSVEEAIDIFRREAKVDLVPVPRGATPAPVPPIDEDEDDGPIVINAHSASHAAPRAQSFIRTIRTPAPSKALDLRCNFGAVKDELRKPGMFFYRHRVKRPFRRSVLTIYIVRSIVGKRGCSLGPFANYATVALNGLEGPSDPCASVPKPSPLPPDNDQDDEDSEPVIKGTQVKPAHSHIDCTQAGNPPLNPTPPTEDEDDPPIVIKHHAGNKAHRTMAHEIGHACGLLHKDKPRQCCNLMHTPPNIRLSEKQADVVRVSRFVSIF